MKDDKRYSFWVCVIGIVILGIHQGLLANEIPEGDILLFFCSTSTICTTLAGYLGKCRPYCIY